MYSQTASDHHGNLNAPQSRWGQGRGVQSCPCQQARYYPTATARKESPAAQVGHGRFIALSLAPLSATVCDGSTGEATK